MEFLNFSKDESFQINILEKDKIETEWLYI